MPPIVDLKNMQRFQRENEYRQWIGLGKLIIQKYSLNIIIKVYVLL